MPITELVFPSFKPELAKEAYSVTKLAFKAISGEPGLLHHRFGRIIRHNGQDISHKHLGVLNIEWQDPSYFHALFPASPLFQGIMSKIIPYATSKATPILFQPTGSNERSVACFESGATQIFLGETGDETAEVKSAWEELITALKKEGGEVLEWTGDGIENAEGSWLGVLGWGSIEKLDASAKNGSVSKAIEKLRSIKGVQEYGVVFEGFESEP